MDSAQRAEGVLLAAEANLYHLDAASLEEWSDVNIIDPGNLPGSVTSGLATVTSSFDTLMAGPSASVVAPANRAFRLYRREVDHALALVNQGRVHDSITFFKTDVDPMLNTLLPLVHDATFTFHERARSAERLKDVGAIITLFAGLLTLALLAIRSGRQRGRLVSSQSQALSFERSEQRILSLMAGSADLVTVVDREGIVRFQSSSIERMLGWHVEDVLGRDLREFLHADDAEALGQILRGAQGHDERRYNLTWRFRDASGQFVPTEAILASKFDDPEIDGFLVSVRDVSERIVLEDALRHQAFHDPLTKLANRSLFEDRLAHAFGRTARTGHSVCLLLADLDDFKDVNDSYGHAFGDQVLIEVANRLRSVLRAEDTVARLGGDEFIILIDEAEDDDGLLLAQRIVTELDASISIDGIEVVVHASIGIVTGSAATGARPQDERRENQLLVDADLAMYEAKRHGRGQFRFYAPVMQEGVQERQAMRLDLARGLRRNQFLLAYQPIFSIETEAIVGAEALVRWQHPELGLVPPMDFIPIAEQTGLILDLGHWVLREACREASTWHDADGGPGPSVAVNVTGSQLRQPSFIQDVRDALEDNGLTPDRLVIEMTESALIEDADDSVLRLEELHDLGVSLAIDDFGTGYSSLSYLRRFNMDILKIDKLFVDELGHKEKRSALVAAMVAMGSALGMYVVAEGIEHRAQLEDLRDLHCDFGQGYLIAKPLTPQALVAMLSQPPAPKVVVASHA